MLRRITTLLVLAAFAGTYAVPLAAAIFPMGVSDCCAKGMCPRMKQAAKAESGDDAMPDCAMSDQKVSTQTSCQCQVSPSQTRVHNALSLGFYVLPAPPKVVDALAYSRLVSAISQFARPLSFIPEAPPPRNRLS